MVQSREQLIPHINALIAASYEFRDAGDFDSLDALIALFRSIIHLHHHAGNDPRKNGESFVLDRLSDHEAKIVLDVGANVGNWSALALELLPAAEIHAFEIIPETFAELATRFAVVPRITLNAFGLSDRLGEIPMNVFDASSEFSSFALFPHGSHRRMSCPVRRGDDYLREFGIERVDFLKIDVEGAEHLVLQGFGHALTEGRIDLIQFEYGQVNILTRHLLIDFYGFLTQHGFQLGKLHPDGVEFRPYRLEDEDFIGPNFIACRNARDDLVQVLTRKMV